MHRCIGWLTWLLCSIAVGTIPCQAATSCVWSTSTTNSWIHISGSGTGNGTAIYTVDASSISRTGSISVAGNIFPIVQAAPASGSFQWVKDIGSKIASNAVPAISVVKVDNSGNALAAGSFTSSVDFGAGYVTSVSSQDIFLAKYSPDGALLMFKQFGVTGDNSVAGLAFDSVGNIILSGGLSGQLNFGGGALASAGAHDFYVAKLSSTGSHIWSKQFGGIGEDTAYAAGVDGQDNVIVTGTFQYTVDFGGGPLTALVSPTSGTLDIFLAKYSGSNGAHLWSRRLGGVEIEESSGLAIDNNGDAIITGRYRVSTDLGGGTLAGHGDTDVLLAKYSGASGTHIWSKGFGNTLADSGARVVIDATDNIIFTGTFTGSIMFDGLTLTSPSSIYATIFLAKFSPSGAIMWAKNFGGASGPDIPAGLALDVSGNILLTGLTLGVISFGGGVLFPIGGEDIFVAKLLPANGGYIWAKRLGGPSHDGGRAITSDQSGNVFVGGYFHNTVDFGGGPITVFGAGIDSFLLKLTP